MRRLLARRPLMPVAQSHLVRADWYAIPYVECTWTKRVPFRSATETNSYTFVRLPAAMRDRKSTRLNSSHSQISYAVFCLKKQHQPSAGQKKCMSRLSHAGDKLVHYPFSLSDKTDLRPLANLAAFIQDHANYIQPQNGQAA